MTNKKRGIILIALGALLLTAAVSLVIYNRCRDSEAGKEAEKTVSVIKAYIETESARNSSDTAPDMPTEDSQSQKNDEEVIAEEQEPEPLEIDGVYYIGLIYLPKLDIELPVTRDWSYNGMANAACRYSGALFTHDLIICAHNYTSFFLNLEKLGVGDEVIFTSLRGKQYHYSVAWQELIGGYDTNTMLSGSDDWDLTLFTCTWSGYSRVTLRCVLE